MQQQFDYIILGAGLSGYTMALRMQKDSYFAKAQIAIVDSNFSKANDRTWCFWEKEEDIFEHLVSYRWPSILVKGKEESMAMPIAPYTYKMVEGGTFYAFAKATLETDSRFSWFEDKVTAVKEKEDGVLVQTTDHVIAGKKVLNSIYQPDILARQEQAVVLQQHFIGWFVQTKEAVFDPEIATYMDFSVPQQGNCRFMYVLPTSPTEALLEYTLFSQNLLERNVYETAIQDYMNALGISEYRIRAKERGIIPMTTYNFAQHNTKHMIHIGTAGGWTKASTGYTFKHSLQKSKDLISFIKSGKSWNRYSLRNRWTFYDQVLLEVLAKHNDKGRMIFTRMFRHGNPFPMFRFLDEMSSFWDELKVIWSAPKGMFFRAALRVLFKR